MSYTLGTDNANGVPISVEFTFNGTAVNWGGANLYSMAPLSNRSESVDGSYELSDLDVELIDTNGSIWGSLGHGTTAFYKPFSATVYVGGQMDYYVYGPSGQTRLMKNNNVGAATYTIHTGQIVEVSRYNRMVRIKSQNNLRAFEDMEWRFPYYRTQTWPDKVCGSYLFFDNNLAEEYPNSANDWDETREKFVIYAAVGTVEYNSPPDITAYQTIPGRGTLGLLPNYFYPGTQFYSDFPIVRYQGTYLGTFLGTIETDADANVYGYSSAAEAEAAKSGTRYIVNKTRLSLRDGTLPTGSHLFLQQNLVLTETPANLFRELIAGHCVTPYFGTSDIESNTFGTSQTLTVYHTFSQRIDPEGGKVNPYIKDLIGVTYGYFSVDVNNKFVYRAYGPRNITANIGTLTSTSIIDTRFKNSREDAKNRIVVKYAWTPEADSFSKSFEIKGSSWAGTTDNPLVIESRWLQNDNEAKLLSQRLLDRFRNTAPKIEVSVSMRHAGVELGSLFSVVDVDTGLNNKVVEVVTYEKDFTESRKVSCGCVDVESVYSRKGYGQWMGGTVLPSGNVSGTSTFGWGTSGTQANINTNIYGTMFVWW